MMADARYEDGDEAPLRLIARAPEDVPVVSALVQDAVFPAEEMRFDRKARRFAVLVNRCRWEDRDAAAKAGRKFERVRSLLVIHDVLGVRSTGIDRNDRETVYSILSIRFDADADGAGTLAMVLAGDGEISIRVEALEVTLDDVTRPYVAPSGKVPDHRA